MTTIQQTVPALRFPEFGGEWVEKRIDHVFQISAGGDVDKARFSPIKTDEFQYPIYANSEQNKGLYGFSSSFKEEGGCVTVSGRGSLGTPQARDHKFSPIVRLLVLRPLKIKNIFFFEYCLSRVQFFVESTGVPQLTGPQISSYKIQFPIFPEQQKIASFLSSVDTKIEQLGKKKALLEQYKNGIMQKLFSQELRFKDKVNFTEDKREGALGYEQENDFPDWKEKSLGEIFKISAGGDVRKLKFSKTKTKQLDIPVYANALKRNGLYGYTDAPKIIDDAVTVTGRGDIGFAEARLSPFVPVVRLLVLLPKTKSSVAFFKNAINSMKIFVESTGVPQLTAPQISKYKLSFPIFDEQQKIADFLSSIDKKIDLINTELNQAKTFKKGLLQQMFI